MTWVAVTGPREHAIDVDMFKYLTGQGVELAKKLGHGSKVLSGISL